MISTHSRYIILHLLAPTLIITLTLTAFVWVIRSMQYIDYIVNYGIPVSQFLYFSSLLAPFFVLIILPVALFISVIYTYNKLISESELIVLNSAGLSTFSLARPALILAGFLMVVSFFVGAFVVPHAYKEFKDIQALSRTGINASQIQKGVFNTPINGLTIYIESQSPNGMLEGILVHDRNREHPITIVAQQGQLLETENGLFLDGINAYHEFDLGEGRINKGSFDSYTIDLTHFRDKAKNRPKETEEYSITELLFPDTSILTERQQAKLKAEGHHRILWPVHSVILTLLALSVLLSGQFNRRGQWRRILSACIIATIFVAFSLIAKSIASSNSNFIFFMYAVSLFPLIICIAILKNHSLIKTATKYLPSYNRA